MTAFLDEILDAVRRDVALPNYRDDLPPEPSRPPPSLKAAVEGAPGSWAMVVERKHRSPGASPPELPERPLDEFVRLVASCGVDALSCLATRPAFAGSPKEVHALAERTRLPILFKDFVIDPVQVDAARRSGASAILLIARLESEGRVRHSLRELAELARTAGLEVVLELHAVEELKVAATLSADLYGVNVRDLDTLALRPDVAQPTFAALVGKHPVLGLSGVEGPEEARRFRRWGAQGILVGSAFARSREPAAFLAALRRAGQGGAR